MFGSQLPAPGFGKYSVPRDPIEAEKNRKEWGAPPDWKSKFIGDKVRQSIEKLHASQDTKVQAKVQAAEFYCMQQEILTHGEAADSEVMGEFRDFLLGKSKFNNDSKLVPWGRRKLVGEDIDAYLEAVMTAKFQYDKKIGMMRDMGMAPRTIEDAWLYFCFFLLKRDIPEELFLKTWAQFYPQGAITAGYTDSNAAREEQRVEHGGDQTQQSETQGRKLGYRENGNVIKTSFSGSTMVANWGSFSESYLDFDFFQECSDLQLEAPDPHGDHPDVDPPPPSEPNDGLGGAPAFRSFGRGQNTPPDTGAGGSQPSGGRPDLPVTGVTRSGRPFSAYPDREFAALLTRSIEKAIAPALAGVAQAIGSNAQQLGELKQTMEASMLKQAQLVENLTANTQMNSEEIETIKELAFENTKGLVTMRGDMNMINDLIKHNNANLVLLANEVSKGNDDQRTNILVLITEMRNSVMATRDHTEAVRAKAMEVEELNSAGDTTGSHKPPDNDGAAGSAVSVMQQTVAQFTEALLSFKTETVATLQQIKQVDPALVDAMTKMLERESTAVTPANLAEDLKSLYQALISSNTMKPIGSAEIEALQQANSTLKTALEAQAQQNATLGSKLATLEKSHQEIVNEAKHQRELQRKQGEEEKQKLINEMSAYVTAQQKKVEDDANKYAMNLNAQTKEQLEKSAADFAEAERKSKERLAQAEAEAARGKEEHDRKLKEFIESANVEHNKRMQAMKAEADAALKRMQNEGQHHINTLIAERDAAEEKSRNFAEMEKHLKTEIENVHQRHREGFEGASEQMRFLQGKMEELDDMRRAEKEARKDSEDRLQALQTTMAAMQSHQGGDLQSDIRAAELKAQLMDLMNPSQRRPMTDEERRLTSGEMQKKMTMHFLTEDVIQQGLPLMRAANKQNKAEQNLNKALGKSGMSKTVNAGGAFMSDPSAVDGMIEQAKAENTKKTYIQQKLKNGLNQANALSTAFVAPRHSVKSKVTGKELTAALAAAKGEKSGKRAEVRRNMARGSPMTKV